MKNFILFIFLRYTCFFTPKPHSPCFLFEDDSANFKGPDGVLLCYKTQLFDEIRRDHCQQQEDYGKGKPVSDQIYKKLMNSIIY